MTDDLADDLQSLSFRSSDQSRSGSETVSTGSSGSGSSAGDAVRRIGSDLSVSDLRFVQRLGSGDIGSVYLAELKCSGAEGRVLAVKVMDKKELEGRNKEGRARTELEILRVLDHPFLPKLYGAAENERWSCLLTEFCPGGDLHVLRQRQPTKRFDEAAVRFYAAEVVAALEYLHMMDIIYRDLKPENVLVRADGHIMLTDFDLSLKSSTPTSTPAQLVFDHHPYPHYQPLNPSCILPSCAAPCFLPSVARRLRTRSARRRPNLDFVAEPIDLRSMSFVGTHEYLAPEIVSGEGHGCVVDWWTLGIFVFELLYGVTPFRGADNEMTLANIVARALEFPKEPFVSAATRDFVSGLLAKDPKGRMGSTVGAAAIRRHPFFHGVNWALLRCAVPPYVPPPFGREGSQSEDDSCPGTPVEYY